MRKLLRNERENFGVQQYTNLQMEDCKKVNLIIYYNHIEYLMKYTKNVKNIMYKELNGQELIWFLDLFGFVKEKVLF